MDILAKIDTLPVSDSWKSKFRMIFEMEPLKFGFLPKFKNEEVFKKSPITMKLNIWAFLFGIFYYIAKGMWKKGIVLQVIVIVIVLAADLLFGDKVSTAVGMGAGSWFALYANLDYYRKMVLNEDFWI